MRRLVVKTSRVIVSLMMVNSYEILRDSNISLLICNLYYVNASSLNCFAVTVCLQIVVFGAHFLSAE